MSVIFVAKPVNRCNGKLRCKLRGSSGEKQIEAITGGGRLVKFESQSDRLLAGAGQSIVDLLRRRKILARRKNTPQDGFFIRVIEGELNIRPGLCAVAAIA